MSSHIKILKNLFNNKISLSIITFVVCTYLFYYFYLYLVQIERQSHNEEAFTNLENWINEEAAKQEGIKRNRDGEDNEEEEGFATMVDMSSMPTINDGIEYYCKINPFHSNYCSYEEGFNLFKSISNTFAGSGSGSIAGGLSSAGDSIVKPIKDLIHELEDTFTKLGYEIKDGIVNDVGGGINVLGKNINRGFVKLGDEINSNVGEPITNIMHVFVGKITEYTKKIAEKFRLLGLAFEEAAIGTEVFFKNLGLVTAYEFEDLWQISSSSVQCGIHFMESFRECLIFYVLDMFAQLLYAVIIRFPLFIVWITTNQDYNGTVQSFFSSILDNLNCATGFNFSYPGSIINKCYRCNDANLTKAVNDLVYDNRVRFPQMLNEANGRFRVSKQLFQQVFRP